MAIFSFDAAVGSQYEEEVTFFDESDYDLLATGIPSAEFVNGVSSDFLLRLTGVVGGEAFGSGQLNHYLSAPNIPTLEAFGTPEAQHSLTGIGIASAEAFGLQTSKEAITVFGTESGEAFGLAEIDQWSFVGDPGNPGVGPIESAASSTERRTDEGKDETAENAGGLGCLASAQEEVDSNGEYRR